MAVGQSNRVVIETGLETKRRLHAKLASEGKTMKGWFQEQADRYLADRAAEPRLPLENDHDE